MVESSSGSYFHKPGIPSHLSSVCLKWFEISPCNHRNHWQRRFRKRVGMWTAPWENKSEPLIPVCNIILSQTLLFMNIGTSLFKSVVVFTHDCTFEDSNEQEGGLHHGNLLMERTRPRAGKHLNPDSVIWPADGGSAAVLRDSSISLSD